MIFNIFLILTIGLVVYFHFVQGFFSATISAALAVIAALLAFSYYEPIVESLLAGYIANSAHGMTLIVLFGAIYLVMRIIFDKVVPGNIRLPFLAEKIGAGVMGLVAGLVAGGVIAVGAQALPFTAEMGGYSKYAVQDTREVTVPGAKGKANIDAEIFEELKTEQSGKFDEETRQALWVPADDLLVSFVRSQSATGALGSRPMGIVHPDLLQEYFGQRLGIQTGTQHVVVPMIKNRKSITSVELFQCDAFPQTDHEASEKMRTAERKQIMKKEDKLSPRKDQAILIVRAGIGPDAGDAKDGKMRFSPGSVRLVAKTAASGAFTNLFPVGTVQDAMVVRAAKLDDFMAVPVKGTGGGIDFAFVVDRKSVFVTSGDDKTKIAPGVFLEINRLAREDLSGKEVKPQQAYTKSAAINVMRKETAIDAAKAGIRQ